MEAWPGIITEWVNCLELLEGPIKELQELEDGEFYKRILKLIAWQSEKDITDEKNILVQFLKEEYPEFGIDNECDNREKNHIYIASLFLLYTSQNPMFHVPMCSKLHSDAQTKIKTFLEFVIPHGNNITSETLKYAIAELGGTVPNTPMTPRTRGLRDFFNSPAAQSVQSYKALSERNRELRKLRNELEAERYEKAELQEDMESYKSKLQSLQQKLQEKTMELKVLRDEFQNPPTPQSCKKESSNTKADSYYKREVDRLENKLMEKHIELDTWEEKNHKLTKQLTSVEKHCHILKEKLQCSEKTVETLQIQAEFKDNEITNLKTTAEDLRTYVKELTKSPSEEESFDLSGVRPLYSSTSSLNTSEVLSSVIEVQLHEAREESNLLKGQVETLNKRIESITEEHKRVVELNSRLEKDVAMLPEVEAKLETALSKISLSSKAIEDLQENQDILVKENNELERIVKTQKQDLSEVEKVKEELRLELNKMKEEHKGLEESLVQETKHTNELHTVLKETKTELDDCRRSIQHLETDKESLKSYIESCKTDLTNVTQAIENNNMDQYVNFELDECIRRLLNDVSREYGAKEKKISLLNSTLSQSNLRLRNLESELSELQKVNELRATEACNLSEKLQENNILIQDLSESKKQLVIREQELLQELNKSKMYFEEKLAKLSNNYSTLQQKYNEEQTSRESLESKLSDNQKEMQRILNIKIELENQLSETQQVKDKLESELMEIKKQRNELSENVTQLQLTLEEEGNQYKKSLDERINDSESLRSENKKLITELHSNNNRLNSIQQELNIVQDEIELKNERIENLVSDMNLLKTKEESLSSENKRITIELQSSNDRLNSIQQELSNAQDEIKLKNERIENLVSRMNQLKAEEESLRSENKRITTELQSSNDRLNSVQQELSTMQIEIKSKNESLENLVSDMSLLKVEKEHLTRLQAKVESKTKTFVEQLEVQILDKQRAYDQLSLQIKLKEDTIESLQKEKSDWYSSELKMKEVIMNLQDVRANQDAVMKTQEKAVNEKALQLNELQKEFELCKVTFSKQVEDEKSLNRTLHSTCKELQEQSQKQLKILKELEELLKKEKKDKEAIKEYCQNEDAKRLEIVKACKILGGLVDDLKFTIQDATQDVDDIYANTMNIQFTECDDKLKNILNIMESAINEMHASRKLISHLYNSNTSLRQALNDHKELVEEHNKTCKEMGMLKSKILELEAGEEKRVKHFRNLIKRKKSLKLSLQSMQASREHLDTALNKLEQKWEEIAVRFRSVFTTNGCLCDELKYIQNKKGDFENTLHKYNISHLNNIKALNNILWQKFTWIEDQIENANNSIEDIDTSESGNKDSFAAEKDVIDTELRKSERLQKDVTQLQQELEDFANQVATFKVNFEAGEIILESELEKKLKVQINELVEEKDNMKSKLDSLRMVNAKLDGQGEVLKNKLRELKSETVPIADAEDLRKDLKHIKDENRKLREEIEDLNKRPKKEDFEKRVKEINDKYDAKIDEMKQKMKSSYNEQVAKLHKDQENHIRERLESLQGKMEQQCRKQAIEINKYKAHVSELSSQLWTVGEKLLIEKQQKEEMGKELNELKVKYHNLKLQLSQQTVAVTNQKTIKTERRDFPTGENADQVFQKVSTLREKTTFERRCSIQSLQAMGNAFNAEDEEGEVFDNIYLADIKDNQQPSFAMDPDRMSVLKMRNSMCKPHLKSSYPAEMQFHPAPFNEEEIKSGSVPEEVFNDSLSQSLLPEQKAKKKDKTQTSYRKPGPPTPSKNGGRLSLQGNELRSPNSKILRERNKDRTTSTPRTLKSIFGSRRQDENVLSTPKERRRSSIFRKSRNTTNR